MRTAMTTLIIENCARTIEKILIPGLTDNYARAQAMNTATALRALAPFVEEKSQELNPENEGMREVLKKVLAVLQEDESLSRNPTRNRLIERLDQELKKASIGPPDANEANYNLKQALVETIKGLDALIDDVPAETMSSMRQQIRSVLRQQLDISLSRAGRK